MRNIGRTFCMFALLAACQPEGSPPVSKANSTPLGSLEAPPPAQGRPNAQIAQDFLDLEFRMESGLDLPRLTRFDGPVTYRLTGNVPPNGAEEMAALVRRLGQEAGITLLPASSGETARLTLDFQPKAALERLEPRASCFVAPNVASLDEFRLRRGTSDLSWQGMMQRDRVAVFLPSDSSPQELRDCLHEEVAQALGPLNDLYRLPDSVFNDDNFQGELTAFDMLILRLHHAPELASGMTRQEVAQRLPALLARMNPAGAGGSGWAAPETPHAWEKAVNAAFDPAGSGQARLGAAQRLVDQASRAGWRDNRLGFAWFLLGRLEMQSDPQAARASFRSAAQIFARLPDGGLRLAHAWMQLAALDLSDGQPAAALSLAEKALPLARKSRNAALEASLLMIEAEAYAALGQPAKSQARRLDTLAPARYGFGSDAAIAARAAEFARLMPQG